jgi:peptidoglycan/LPS O-acetylase OafA/YrhL
LFVFLFHSLHAAYGFTELPWKGLFRDFQALHSPLVLYPLTYGSMGVAMFFVVSGFCIHMSHARSSTHSWSEFARKRFFRIYPPYFLALLVFYFMWPFRTYSLSSPGMQHQLWTHLLEVHNLSGDTFFGINGSFWSIAVEIQLYMIYPIMLFLVWKYGWRYGLLIVAIAELAIRSFQSIGIALPDSVIGSPFAFWFSWSIGAFLAQRFIERKPSPLSKFRFDLLLVLALLLPFFRPTEPYMFLATALLTGIAIEKYAYGFWQIPKGKYLTQLIRHMSFLGVVSYSFYLIHQPILLLIRRLPVTFHGLPLNISPHSRFILCIGIYPLLLILAYLMHRYIEIPSTKLNKTKHSSRVTA